MKKKLLNVILSIAMSIAIISVTSTNVSAQDFTGWTVLTDGGTLNNGKYFLNDNVILTNNITVAGDNVTIDLNGFSLNGNDSGNVVTVSSGANLMLTDSSEPMTGKITGGNATYGGGVYVDGNFTMNGGTIAYNTATSHGGGVYVAGNFTMNGGTIAYNTVTSHGGGIFVQGGAQVNITNGIIEYNHADQSGGGAQIDGIFNISGGTIQNNNANNDGGGISINGSSGKATLTGTAKIINNKANVQGGGLSYYGATNKVTLGNKVQITDNLGNCSDTPVNNNVYLYANNLCITLGTGTDAPVDGMKVGITTYTAPSGTNSVQFTANGTANDANYFFSDNPTHGVTFKNGHLELFIPPVAYNSTKHVSYNTLTGAIAAAVSGDVIELWENDNAENITLPVGVILYTKSNYTGTVTTDSGKAIVKQDITGNFQYKYSVAYVLTITYKDQGNQDFSGIHETGYPSTFLAEVPTELKSATKDGYTFGGWFVNEDCIGNPITVLYNTYASNLTLYAKWILNTPPKPKPEYKIPNTGVEDVSTNNHSIN